MWPIRGGQYTHAAVWTAMAFAALGDGKKAWELFDLINPIRHGDAADRRLGSRRTRSSPTSLRRSGTRTRSTPVAVAEPTARTGPSSTRETLAAAQEPALRA